jgi:glutamine synthetase
VARLGPPHQRPGAVQPPHRKPHHRRGGQPVSGGRKDAVDHFERDPVLHGALGQELSDLIIRVKRDEWNAFHCTVSQWELDNYIGAY